MIKINHLTNLHDARFAAAEEVDFISFALAKGNFKKISWTTYQDIIQWLSGIYVVIDFEKDADSLLEFTERSIPFDFIQVDESLVKHLPQALYPVTMVFSNEFASAQNWLQEGFVVESPFAIDHPKHFQKVSCQSVRQANRHYSLDETFFSENYELDYELFRSWKENF